MDAASKTNVDTPESGVVAPKPLLKEPVFIELPKPDQNVKEPPQRESAKKKVAGHPLTTQIVPEPRVPAWDGIRGVAILLVVIFRFSEIGYPRWMGPVGFVIYNFGWCGVDLFFVLSGFLITGILHDSKGSANYFSSFYGRRAVRIFPAYYAVLVIMFVIVPLAFPHLLDRPDLPVYGSPWVYLLYVSNYCFVGGGDAFGSLGHTWSLAVEEQFYLIWPALVWMLSSRKMLKLCAAIIVATIALRAVLLVNGVGVWPIYLMSITRFDELAMGGMIAILIRSRRGREMLRKSRWVAIFIPPLMAGLWLLKKRAPQLGELVEESVKFDLIAAIFAIVLGISATISQESLLNRALAARLLRFFGKYSYALYLYHVPVFLIIERHTGKPINGWQMLLDYTTYFVCTLVLALLSWNLIEKHALNLKRLFPVTKRNVPQMPMLTVGEPTLASA